MLHRTIAGTAITAMVLTSVVLLGAVNGAAASPTFNLAFSGHAPAQTVLHIGGGTSDFSAGATLSAGLDWQANDQVGLTYNDSNLRQGSQLDLADTATPGAGTVSVNYAVNGNLSFDSFSQTATDSFPCAMPTAGDASNTCGHNTSIALDSVTLATTGFLSLKVALSLNVATTVSAAGSPITTTRTASVAGGQSISDAALTFTGPTPAHLTDPMALSPIACTQPAGSHLLYTLTSVQTHGTLTMVSTVDLVASAVVSPLVGPDVTVFSGAISPTSIVSNPIIYNLTMTAPDQGTDLGAILPDVTPPTVNAGGPYSAAEGGTVSLDGSGSTDKCGPPTLAWTFGDGGSGVGPAPTHSYSEEGVYAATLTATNVTGLSSSTSFNVAVSDAPLTAAGRTIITAQAFSGVVASFTDADPAGTLSDYTATINWGDGSTDLGTLAAVGSGFTVSGSHTFAATALGPQTFTTTVCDVGGSCATVTSQALIFTYTTDGAFVVGDSSAGSLVTGAIGSGNSVTFWGAQWRKANDLSGGGSPASFKGFANNPAMPACGTAWSTGPGNSARPAATVPTYTAMIVASTVTKAGPDITGNTLHVVIVRTMPGYAANPGHAGVGVIVGVLC